LQVKLELKYDKALEKAIQTWIEQVLGEKFPVDGSFVEHLRSGRRLCLLLNKLQGESLVSKINTGANPFMQRVCFML
jgi:hypothetical protein